MDNLIKVGASGIDLRQCSSYQGISNRNWITQIENLKQMSPSSGESDPVWCLFFKDILIFIVYFFLILEIGNFLYNFDVLSPEQINCKLIA